MTSKKRLIYLPLGGAGEIGMNTYVYGYGREGAERLIVVDLGVAFSDMDTTPGVDLIMADISWLKDRADRIEAIFITHAHEDHIGALPYLWPNLRARIFTRRFTAHIGKLKLTEAGLSSNDLEVLPPWPARVKVGPFDVGFVPVSHSIPESSALVIDTPLGRIFHTGDFKVDHSPVVGEAWNDAMIRSIVAERPVKALVCDSTNVFSPNPGRSESVLQDPLRNLIAQCRGAVVATTFGSNIARLKSLAEAGRANGRSVCVLGRSMRRMLSAAQKTDILSGFPPMIALEEALKIPRQELMLLVTGSQGERRAAAAQLSRGKYLGFELKAGDTFLFSSKTIPGNERGVIRLMNAFATMDVDVLDENNGLYHVSGHANRPDLEYVHALLSPEMLIPAHGEYRHLREHVKIAKSAGMMAEVVPNGAVVDLGGNTPQIVEHVEAGRSYLDGSRMIKAMDGVVRDRIRMALNGHVVVTLILDEDDLPLGDAWVETMGLPEFGSAGQKLSEMLESDLTEYLENAGNKLLRQERKLEDTIRRVVRQITMEEIGKKPEVTIIISRLSEE